MAVLRQAAAAWVFDDEGRVLLIRENYGGRRYGPPGGAVENGESPLQAVCREVREETGVSFSATYLVGLYHFVYPKGRLEPWLAFAFFGGITGNVSVPGTGEIADVGWFDPEEIPEPVTNLTRHALADARQAHRGVYKRIEID